MTGRVGDAMVRHPITHGTAVPLAAIAALLEDDHVHMALIVGSGGELVTTIELADLARAARLDAPARTLGTLAGRTARPRDSLADAADVLRRSRRRRLAVVDEDGSLAGLLCLRRDGRGFCTDEGIRARVAARTSRAEPSPTRSRAAG